MVVCRPADAETERQDSGHGEAAEQGTRQEEVALATIVVEEGEVRRGEAHIEEDEDGVDGDIGDDGWNAA